MKNLVTHLNATLKFPAIYTIPTQEDTPLFVAPKGTDFEFAIYADADSWVIEQSQLKYSFDIGYHGDDIAEFTAKSQSEVSFFINSQMDKYFTQLEAERTHELSSNDDE